MGRHLEGAQVGVCTTRTHSGHSGLRCGESSWLPALAPGGHTPRLGAARAR